MSQEFQVIHQEDSDEEEQKDIENDDDNSNTDLTDNNKIKKDLFTSNTTITNSSSISLSTQSTSASLILKSKSISNNDNNIRDNDNINSKQIKSALLASGITESQTISVSHSDSNSISQIKQNDDAKSSEIQNNIQNNQNHTDDDDDNDEKDIQKEGNVNNIGNNNNKIQSPIISNINQSIMDNRYLNGTHVTPGNDNDDDSDDDDDAMSKSNDKYGEDSDQSDEEKDNIFHQNQKIKLNHHDIGGVKGKYRSRINLLLLFVAFVVLIIGLYYGYILNQTNNSFESIPPSSIPDVAPNPPKLHCPSSTIYAPINGDPFYLSAQHADHPNSTTYSWNINDLDVDNDMLISGEDTSTLMIINIESDCSLLIDLYLTSIISSIYIFNKQCTINIIFYFIPYFGIDLGTTYSCISYKNRYNRNTSILIADKYRNEYCIPTAIYFNTNSEIIIGENALKQLAYDPVNVIYDIKRIIGRNCDDNQLEIFRIKHEFNISCNNLNNINIFVPNIDDSILAEQALSIILSYLVSIGSAEFNIPYNNINNVVVSIPALFHNGQRKAIRTACYLAGLNVAQLVIEPTAAALAYSYYSSKPADNFKLFLTLDIGGGTTDCSVLRCTGIDCQVLSVTGNSSLGGIDFDYVIRDIMIQKYSKLHSWNNIRTSPKLNAKFLKVAEKVKKSLSYSTQHQVTMTNDELLRDNGDFNSFYTEKKSIIISRIEFENNFQTIKIINSIINLVKNSINTERISLSNVRMILMIGGTTKIPIIQETLRKEFKQNNNNKLELVFPDCDPQLMVVKGSGIIGGSLGYISSSSADEIILEDVIPLSLGFSICIISDDKSESESECGLMDVIIPKNSHYPIREKVIYCQKDPLSSIAKLDLYEGDSKYVADNYLLSHLQINNIPPRNKNECNSIIVEFIIDKNGIAQIEATTNNNKIFKNKLSVISNDGNLLKNDIKLLQSKMIKLFKNYPKIQDGLLKSMKNKEEE